MDFIKVNGVLIHYRLIQNALSERETDQTFVFINSLGTDFRIWDEVVKALKDHGNVLLFDKRGHGLSGVVLNTKGLLDYVEDTVALLDHLGIKKCTLVGLSVGGMIAQLLACHYPGLVDKLILCDTRHKIGNEIIWNERIAAIKEDGLQSISGGVTQKWFSENFRANEKDKVAGYRNMLEHSPALGYIETCKAIRDADLTEIAKQVKAPALCVVGSEDKSTTPEEVKDLADLIDGSIYKIIEGSGHIPCVDNPGTLSKMIIDFIKG